MGYDEVIDPKTDAFASHRGSKKFAELAAWDFMQEHRPKATFELVTLCPPLVFGPMVHPRLGRGVESLIRVMRYCGSSRRGKMKAPLGPGVRFWVDVRDLARAHVTSKERAGNEIVEGIFRAGAISSPGQIDQKENTMAGSKNYGEGEVGVDGWTAERRLGVTPRGFQKCVADLLRQVVSMTEEDA